MRIIRIKKYANLLELLTMLNCREHILPRWVALIVPAATLILGACGGASNDSSGESAAEPRSVVVYSARAEQLIKPIFDAYTAETGVPVKYMTDSEQPLIQKLKA